MNFDEDQSQLGKALEERPAKINYDAIRDMPEDLALIYVEQCLTMPAQPCSNSRWLLWRLRNEGEEFSETIKRHSGPILTLLPAQIRAGARYFPLGGYYTQGEVNLALAIAAQLLGVPSPTTGPTLVDPLREKPIERQVREAIERTKQEYQEEERLSILREESKVYWVKPSPKPKYTRKPRAKPAVVTTVEVTPDESLTRAVDKPIFPLSHRRGGVPAGFRDGIHQPFYGVRPKTGGTYAVSFTVAGGGPLLEFLVGTKEEAAYAYNVLADTLGGRTNRNTVTITAENAQRVTQRVRDYLLEKGLLSIDRKAESSEVCPE